jgi:hypothetical protein
VPAINTSDSDLDDSGEQEREKDQPRDVGELAAHDAGGDALEHVVVQNQQQHARNRRRMEHGVARERRRRFIGNARALAAPWNSLRSLRA